jgi:hypothetical protein
LPGGVLVRLMLGERQGQLLWLGDGVYAVSLYVDGYRTISSALASLSDAIRTFRRARHSYPTEAATRELPSPLPLRGPPRVHSRIRPAYLPHFTVGTCRWGRIVSGRQAAGQRYVPGALTTGRRRRIPVGYNGLDSMPNSRVDREAGDPGRPCEVHGVNRQDALV